MAEATLALSEQKAQDLGELLATAEQEQRSLVQRQAKEHRLEQQVGRHGSGRGCMVAGAGGILAPSHPQEAAERESKLLRDLSAANEKNLLLQSQVWGCGARCPRKPRAGTAGLGLKLPPHGAGSPGGRVGAEGEISAGAAVPDQTGADQHVGRAEDAGCPGRGWACAGLPLRGLETGALGQGRMGNLGNEETPRGVPPTLFLLGF